jgi:hypothetical protein
MGRAQRNPSLSVCVIDGFREDAHPILRPRRIQLSNSHYPSDMRHRPCCWRRGGAVVSCIPAPCERACGTPGARCTPGPDADAVFRKLAHQDFRKARAMARRSACGVLSTCRCLPRRPIKVTLVWPCATGPGERSSWAGRVSNLVVRHLIRGPVPSASKPCRLSQWYPDHRRCGLPADSRSPHIP